MQPYSYFINHKNKWWRTWTACMKQNSMKRISHLNDNYRVKITIQLFIEIQYWVLWLDHRLMILYNIHEIQVDIHRNMHIYMPIATDWNLKWMINLHRNCINIMYPRYFWWPDHNLNFIARCLWQFDIRTFQAWKTHRE